MFKSKTQRAKQLRRKTFLNFEKLEDRSLLAGNVLAIDSAGYMLLIGDGAANEVAITQNANGTLNVAGVGTTINGQASATLGAATRGALVLLGEGNDSLSISGTTATPLNFGSATTIDLGGGNNNLALSNFRSAGSLTITGGLGNDTISAARAPAALTGFGVEVGGNLVISTLLGDDTINLRNSAVAVVTVVNTNLGDDLVDVRNSTFGHVALFVGGPHVAGDTFTGADNTFAFPPFVLQFENQTAINAPVAVNDTVNVNVTTPVTPVAFNVLTNDNPSGGTFGAVNVVTPLPAAAGTLVQGPNGNFTFTPAPAANGAFTFQYTVVGEGAAVGTSNVATVTINVNQPPTIAPIAAQTTPEETPIAIPIVVADVGATPASLTVTATSTNPGVIASIVPNAGNTEIVVTPALNQPPGNVNVTSDITVTVTDAQGVSASTTFTLTVTPVNDSPVVVTNEITIEEGETLLLTTADIQTTDVDNTNAELVYTVTGVTNGHFELNNVLTTTFTQDDIDNGLVEFVHDGGELAPTYTLSVTDGDFVVATPGIVNFTNVNDQPTLLPGLLVGTITLSNFAPDEDFVVTVGDAETPVNDIDVTVTASDPNDIADFTVSAGPAANQWTITIDPNFFFFGNESITVFVTADDTSGAPNATVTHSFTLHIT